MNLNMKVFSFGAVFVFFCAICHADVDFPSYEDLTSFDVRLLSPKPLSNATNRLIELKSVVNRVHDVNFLKSLADSNGETLKSSAEDGSVLFSDKYNVSETCRDHWNRTFTALRANEYWALKLIDSSAKLESGILEGNTKWLGSYDECFNLEVPVKAVSLSAFETHFCFAHVPINLTDFHLKIDIGLCVPKACSSSDVTKLYNDLFAAVQRLRPTINPIRVSSVDCQEHSEIDTRAIAAIIILGVFAVIILISSTFDLISHQWSYCTGIPKTGPTQSIEIAHFEGDPQLVNEMTNVSKRKKSTLEKLLLSFSAYTNGKKLLAVNHSPGTLTALNGIRFLSISWVVLGHTYSSVFNKMNNSYAISLSKRWTFQTVLNAQVSVDSFFALSGLLLSYLTLKEMKRGKGKFRINWLMFYFHRFWRLTPVYMIVLMVTVCLGRYLGDGPVWPKDGFEKNCKDTWWRNLLYINNLFEGDEFGTFWTTLIDSKNRRICDCVLSRFRCFGVAWYLANDMQFFILSPLMLLPLYFHYSIGIGVCFMWLLGSAITPGVVSNVLDLPPSSFGGGGSQQGRADYFNNYYIRPYCRIGPYIVGIIVGSFLYRTDCKAKINKLLNVLLWLMFVVLAIVVLYGLRTPIAYPEEALNRGVSAFYNATHKIVWGACICWVIFACATGNGGFINTLLSWSPFVPLARLSYCIYLIHPIVMFVYIGSQRSHYNMDDIHTIYLFLGHLVMSTAMAFVVSVAFEAPMMGLEKILLRRQQRR
ncbi:nose resistant to fluoxetine protein 6-like isoform X3 [Ostrea edulis]|uniref:nose resistant to fluoxetine protein 6-like isoform X3 n=1 Tax=Ostrea edulis TaxID=37623 RepID=UPI0024AF96ED|nr:nose resistant to fluoxetine protein 6-like isoform X3 [Ostrea edulis]